ncbi:hypothetical protein [Devosia nitrariae]|uniref:DUF1127 domain-containing protein n=1 Tax=Devosia nitrariae TaxID=2071872 RepID=A0ABQ5VZK8_9HYPH|nr:hypothetical protein [Devosia nitrariae]GLQ52936.1 hypothetical protein GCM10010862_01940 [Devosia nitrariae]
MAYLLSSERPAAAAMPLRQTNLLARWFAAFRAARTRKLALASLLEMDESRLRDLGIQRQDVLEAVANSRLSLGQVLSTARARNARC